MIEKANAVIRVALGIEPMSLSDDEWAQRFQEWVYVKKLEQRSLETILRKIANESFSG